MTSAYREATITEPHIGPALSPGLFFAPASGYADVKRVAALGLPDRRFLWKSVREGVVRCP